MKKNKDIKRRRSHHSGHTGGTGRGGFRRNHDSRFYKLQGMSYWGASASENAGGGNTKVAMVHGEKDQVVPVKFAREFAEKYGLPITVFEGQGHSLSDDPACPDKVADLAIDFFK